MICRGIAILLLLITLAAAFPTIYEDNLESSDDTKVDVTDSSSNSSDAGVEVDDTDELPVNCDHESPLDVEDGLPCKEDSGSGERSLIIMTIVALARMLLFLPQGIVGTQTSARLAPILLMQPMAKLAPMLLMRVPPSLALVLLM